MAYENNEKKPDSVYSIRVKAGKRRTYFFDVRETRGNDFYVTITESRKRFDSDGYDRHKIFLYKEDFNKFLKGLNETIDHVKTELMPDFDFDAFNHDTPYEGDESATASSAATNASADINESSPASGSNAEPSSTGDNGFGEEVDKW
ncbi:MAG: DUF3276 family protein [Ferruginibacter sp.]|nr:DUF3276 family protein [Ferruginibacter sp.]